MSEKESFSITDWLLIFVLVILCLVESDWDDSIEKNSFANRFLRYVNDVVFLASLPIKQLLGISVVRED